MRLRWLALAAAIFAAPVAIGQVPPQAAIRQVPNPVLQQMQRVEGTLNRLSQEQMAVYQQFQMVQEMRRSEERLAVNRLPIYRSVSPLTPPANVDDLQRDENARTQRMNELQAESDRLYTRYRELEEQKRALLDTLTTLAQTTPDTAATDVAGDAIVFPVPTPVPPMTQPSPGFSGTFPGFTGPAPGFAPAPVPSPPPAAPSR
jgi:hypothetical protein